MLSLIDSKNEVPRLTSGLSSSLARSMPRLWLAIGAVIFLGSVSGPGCTYDYSQLQGSSRDAAFDVSFSTRDAGGGGLADGAGARDGGGIDGVGSGGVVGSGGTRTGGGSGLGGGGSGGDSASGGVGAGGRFGNGGQGVAGSSGTAGNAGSSAGGRGGISGSPGGGSGAGGGNAVAGRGGAAGGGAGTGVGGRGGTAGVGTTGGAGGVATRDPDLVLWYKFDEASGTVAADSSGEPGGPRNGALRTFGVGGAVAFSTTHQVGTNAVSLTSNGSLGGGYVVIPSLAALAPGAITVSAWVNISAAGTWQRVFDVGSATTGNMSMTTTDLATGSVRFVIRVNGDPVDQLITTTTRLSFSTWHHLVVVLRAGATYTGQIFVDGVLAGSNPAMTFHPVDLGATTENYIGRARFLAYPYLPGLIDDFRVYRRALTAAEIRALFAIR